MTEARDSASHMERLLSRTVEAVVEIARPLRVVLFGSFARGEAGPHSDLDILVIVPRGRHRRDTARAIYRRLAGLGHAVDVVVVTAEDVERFRDSPGLIISTALSEGREVYAA
jgi:uncharacterized protein